MAHYHFFNPIYLINNSLVSFLSMTRHHGKFEGLFLILNIKSSPSNESACDKVLKCVI